jgi:hypothetical protein
MRIEKILAIEGALAGTLYADQQHRFHAVIFMRLVFSRKAMFYILPTSDLSYRPRYAISIQCTVSVIAFYPVANPAAPFASDPWLAIAHAAS